MTRLSPLLVLVLLIIPALAQAGPWVWDQDGDGLDDRLEAVNLSGFPAAFEDMDTMKRLRFEVAQAGTVLSYGAYVRFTSLPTPQDSTDLVQLGAEVITRFLSVPYIRIHALYPTLVLVAGLPRVDRIEAMTLMYPENWRGTRGLRVEPGSGAPFPTLSDLGAPRGAGQVVAVLDTGINDAPSGPFPGHHALLGKVAGGAKFEGPGPAGYTAWNASVNPAQNAGGLSGYHGTHVAGTIAGLNPGHLLSGVAPDATLLDVKVLSDQGIGYGLAEGLEWCVQNASTLWPGGAAGIQVINLSLSGLDESDGTDCVSALVDAAADAGIVVVAAMGNEGGCAGVPAPAAADGAIAVGASRDGLRSVPEDDGLAPFTSDGPRESDGDLDFHDELKPDVVAHGVRVLSAWGDPLDAGDGFARSSGTSMSAAFVSGLAAVLRSAQPGLTPAGLKQLLRDTAWHRFDSGKPCSAVNPTGADARYHTGWGFGIADAVAAYLDLTAPSHTQFVRLEATRAPGSGTNTVTWTTQREAGPLAFQLERADDAGGAPGPFTPVGAAVPATGSASLDVQNRTTYSVPDVVAAGPRWYRVVSVGGPVADTSEALFAVLDDSLATGSYTVTHVAPHTDLELHWGAGPNPASSVWEAPVLLPESIDSVSVSGTGESAITIHGSIIASSQAAGTLPPSPSNPWWLVVADSGSPATGSVVGFTVHTPQTYSTDTPLPLATRQGAAVAAWIPQSGSVAVPDRPTPGMLRVDANPMRGSGLIHYTLEASGEIRLSLIDVQGRRLALIDSGPRAAGAHAVAWPEAARTLPAGRYYLVLQGPSGHSTLAVTRLR